MSEIMNKILCDIDDMIDRVGQLKGLNIDTRVKIQLKLEEAATDLRKSR